MSYFPRHSWGTKCICFSSSSSAVENASILLSPSLSSLERPEIRVFIVSAMQPALRCIFAAQEDPSDRGRRREMGVSEQTPPPTRTTRPDSLSLPQRNSLLSPASCCKIEVPAAYLLFSSAHFHFPNTTFTITAFSSSSRLDTIRRRHDGVLLPQARLYFCITFSLPKGCAFLLLSLCDKSR